MPYSGHHTDPNLDSTELRWVFGGAMLLAFIAGFVNIVALEFFAVPVSHMSGAVSRMGLDLGTDNRADLIWIAGIVGGFLTGAIASGAIIGGRQLKPGRRYGVVLMIESVLLAVATLLLTGGNLAGVVLASTATGMQNAMASSYYGLVLRTTHVTGVVTDIGVMIGQWIRFRTLPTWKLILLLSLLCGFFAGGWIGTLAHTAFGLDVLYLPAALCLVTGGTYYIWRHRAR